MKLKHLMLSLMLTVGLGQPVMAADTAKPASEATKAANAAVLKELPFNNKQAFEDSKKGFIAPLENKGVVKNAKGDIIWDLPSSIFSVVTSQPLTRSTPASGARPRSCSTTPACSK
jgi:alkyl sulfatase BDS1-like metallo-beta-lactamase superfamily hydrolase